VYIFGKLSKNAECYRKLRLDRFSDWLTARRSDQCAAPPANHRCAVGLLPLLREEFRLLKLILHSELRRRAFLWTKVHHVSCKSLVRIFPLAWKL